MKKCLLTVLGLFACIVGAAAQENEIPGPKRHYIHFAHAAQQLTFDGGPTFKSDYGAAAEFGSTFFFNARRPAAGMTRFGLDFSYLDLQYASFTFEEHNANDGRVEYNGQFANIGMQVGPSVTVSPIRNLHAKAYVHYAPSVAVFAPYDDFDELLGGYTGYITGGVQVSYRFLTLGVELRGGESEFSWLTESDEDMQSEQSFRTKLPGTRIIFGFRF